MLVYLTLIFACQLIGELIVVAAALPIPGPVIGMALLFCGMLVYGAVPDELGQVADTLLTNLSLLFVPAGVGVLLHARLIGNELIPISLALVVSTISTIAVTGLAMSWLNAKKAPAQSGQGTE